MRHLKKIWSILVALLLFNPLCANEKVSSKIYLLRAPRSGSHWLFYCINAALDKNILHSDGTRVTEYPLRNGGDITTAHNPYDLHLNVNSDETDLLIFMVRNYRECMLRHFSSPEAVYTEIRHQTTNNHLANNKEWVFNFHANQYFHNFRVYELWNPKNRMIVYYEDLIENPRLVLSQIAHFIEESNKQNAIDNFMQHFNDHFEKSLQIYEETYTSHTRGKSLLYHTNKAGLDKCFHLDTLVKNAFPEFVEKYLSRYLLDRNQ